MYIHVLSDADEKILRGIVVRLVVHFKIARMRKMLEPIIDRRVTLLDQLLSTYVRKQPGYMWLQLPRLHDLCSLTRLFAPLVPLPLDGSDELVVWKAWKTTFLPAVEAWTRDQCVQLAKRLPASTRVLLDEAKLQGTEVSSVTPVFSCSGAYKEPTFAVGFDEAVAHRHPAWASYDYHGQFWVFSHRQPEKPCMRYNEAATATVKRLLDLVGVRDTAGLDEADARFVCEECGVKGPISIVGRTSMTWRECVSTCSSVRRYLH
jgi:hypothetical protein